MSTVPKKVVYSVLGASIGLLALTCFVLFAVAWQSMESVRQLRSENHTLSMMINACSTRLANEGIQPPVGMAEQPDEIMPPQAPVQDGERKAPEQQPAPVAKPQMPVPDEKPMAKPQMPGSDVRPMTKPQVPAPMAKPEKAPAAEKSGRKPPEAGLMQKPAMPPMPEAKAEKKAAHPLNAPAPAAVPDNSAEGVITGTPIELPANL